MDFILIVLAAIAIHRIWNYEVIFASLRGWLTHFIPPHIGYVFTCAACNALWIAAFVAGLSLTEHPVAKGAVFVLAVYSLIRLHMWANNLSWKNLFIRSPIKESFTQPKKEESFTQSKKKEQQDGCSDCEVKKKGLEEEAKRVRPFKRRVVIMTTLSDFNSSYSLSSCVLDQARALSANKNWLIQVWVMQITNDALWPKDMPSNVELKKVIPQLKWQNDMYDGKTAGFLAATLSRELVALGNADIITHDVLFQKAYLNFAAAIHSIETLKNFRWLHQAHSGPSPLPERPEKPLLYRYSLPQGHRLLNINDAHHAGFMRHYGITHADIETCPNIRDPRILYRASPEISSFISTHGLLEADIVQIYPLSTDRAFWKGAQHVIKIFGSLKHQENRVRLVIANAHANGNEDIIERLRTVGNEWGLTDKELIFTSEHFTNRKSAGLSAADTQVLLQVSNLFIFPTTAEASSLVLTEAALAGALLVLNRDVPSINFDVPDCELTYPFGISGDAEWPPGCPTPDHIARDISGLLHDSRSNTIKRDILKERNLDAIGRHLTGIIEMKPYR